jgi:hypothetical protein
MPGPTLKLLLLLRPLKSKRRPCAYLQRLLLLHGTLTTSQTTPASGLSVLAGASSAPVHCCGTHPAAALCTLEVPATTTVAIACRRVMHLPVVLT